MRTVAVVAVALGLGCAHELPRLQLPSFRSEAEKHAFVEAYLSRLNPPPSTRVVLASLRAEVDGSFGYLLVVGDEAIQNLTRGRPRRVKLGARGLGEVLARYDAARVARLGSASDEEGGGFMDGATWEIEFRQGDARAQYSYRCLTRCLPLTGERRVTLICLLASCIESDFPMDTPPPDLSADPI